MHISKIMSGVVHTIHFESTLVQASRQMTDENIGFLPVVVEANFVGPHTNQDIVESIGFKPVEEEEALAGVITDRDIIVRAIATGKDPSSTPVSEVMTQQFASCYLDSDITEAAAVMKERKVRRVFVMTRDEHLVGVLSLDDISIIDAPLAGEVLKAISESVQHAKAS